jgi:hypothetical protein
MAWIRPFPRCRSPHDGRSWSPASNMLGRPATLCGLLVREALAAADREVSVGLALLFVPTPAAALRIACVPLPKSSSEARNPGQ